MTNFPSMIFTLCVLMICLVVHATEDNVVYLDDIIVRAQTDDEEKRFKVHVTEGFHGMPADTTQLLKRVPGANINSNGPLSSMAQYRGMFGARLHQSVDGVPITSAGTNAMDPPLSYAPRLQLKTLEVYRGIAPVSAGLETIGGAVIAKSNIGEFTDGNELELHGEINGDYNSNNDGVSYGMLNVMANDSHKFFVTGSREDGDDFEFDGGTIDPTVHERKNLKLGYGWRFGDNNQINFDYSRVETEKTGTPGLPMDVMFFDGDIWNSEYQFSWGDIGINAKLYHSEIKHGMNNFSLRTQPVDLLTLSGGTKREIFPESKATGYSISSTFAIGDGYVKIGSDGDNADHDSDIFNPDDPEFRVTQINEAERDRFGIYGEWFAPINDTSDIEFGFRLNRVSSDAKNVSASPGQTVPTGVAGNGLPPMAGSPAGNVGALANAFNRSDRSQSDNHFDAVIKLNYNLSDSLTLELGVARKTRSPNFLERYLWVPLEASGGLSDGNNYIGNVELDPEESYEFEIGLDHTTETCYLRPRIFFKEVDDYIQGTPVAENDPIKANIDALAAATPFSGGRSTLQFNNVDAEFYGGDIEMGTELDAHWRVDSVISYVRGERDDINDDILRVAPLNGLVAVTYRQDAWYVSIEGVFYDDQDRVATQDDDDLKNDEQKTAGYSLFNLRGQYNVNENIRISAGIENLFDEDYQDHLAGINRVADNPNIPVNEKLPGNGRSFYLAVNVSW